VLTSAVVLIAACSGSPGVHRSEPTMSTPTRSTSPPACSSGFDLSLVSDPGGQPDPPSAAEWFAAHGGVKGLPSSDWQVIARDVEGVTLESGRSTLHVVEGRDKSWQVDSGSNCG